MTEPMQNEQRPPDTVLAVDDEQPVLDALKRVLAKRHRLLTARSVSEAEALLSQYPVKVIVCDHFMPGEDGLTFLSRLRNPFPRVQRILFTGFADQDMLLKAINEGRVYQYIVKPSDPATIRRIVADAIAEYDRLEAMDEISIAHEQLQRENGALPGWVRRLQATAQASISSSSSMLLVGVVSILALLALLALGGGLILLLLYFLKSMLGIDLLPDAHFLNWWS